MGSGRSGRGRLPAALSGAGTVRTNLAWATIQPAPGGDYEWGVYDEMVSQLARAAIRIQPVLIAPPAWAHANPESPGYSLHLPGQFMPVSSPHLAAWDDYVRAVVGRYGVGGTFWSDHSELPELPMREWEVGNEPNLAANNPGYVSADRNRGIQPGSYAELLIHTAAVLRSAPGFSPTSRVLFAGLFSGRNDTGGGCRDPGVAASGPCVRSASQFIRDAYAGGRPAYPGSRGRKLAAFFDGASLHPYSGGAPAFAATGGRCRSYDSSKAQPSSQCAVTVFRATLEEFDDLAPKGIWITEVGWQTGLATYRGEIGFVYRTPAGQAERLTQFFDWVKANRGPARQNIARLTWFSYHDYTDPFLFGDSSGNPTWDNHSGVSASPSGPGHGAPKCSWTRFLDEVLDRNPEC